MADTGMQTIVAVAVAVAIGATLMGPVADLTANSTDVQTVNDESFNPDPGNYTELDNYNIEEGSETVEYDDGAGYSTVSDSNYTMNYSDGAIKLNESGPVSSSDDARISYNHSELSGPSSTVVDLIPLFMALLLLAFIAAPLMRRV